MEKRALITGIGGQDGSYLARFLLDKGYEVHGIVRRMALESPGHQLWRLEPILDRLILHSASLDNQSRLVKVVSKVNPHECYHLAARSFVSYSFEDEFSTINTNINGTLCMLSSLRDAAKECKFYFAGSSEMFGNPDESPQNETTRLSPRSPYGISKTAGFHLTASYRTVLGLRAWSGILYNHESPVRSFEFVTRKITNTAARIKHGLAKELRLGNMEARRDWGFAGDYVEAMWLMLQQERPDDYVIATGEDHSVREFVELAFQEVGLDWRDFVVCDERFVRPVESHILRGDFSKATRELGWRPKVHFAELVRMMVRSDMGLVGGATADGLGPHA